MISVGFADLSLGLGLVCSLRRIIVGSVDQTVCKCSVQVGDALLAIGDRTLKLLNGDVDFRQELSILKTAPRPLYSGL